MIAYRDLVNSSRLEQAMEDLGGLLPLNAKWLAGRFPEQWGERSRSEMRDPMVSRPRGGASRRIKRVNLL